jgi:hypothetical protein
MTVALVDGRVGGKEVHVALAFGVGDPDTFGFSKDDGKRMVALYCFCW